MMNHRERDRRSRLSQLQMFIAKALQRGDLDEKKLIINFSALTGTAKRTVKEYLEVLEAQGKVKREFGVVFIERESIEEAEIDAEEIISQHLNSKEHTE